VSGFFLFAASFLATGVEMVEALTIILATGLTRGWRSTFLGAGLAAAALAVIVAALGFTLTTVVPIDLLRLVVGGFLLIFGLQWLRKAVLRYGGLKAFHDEDQIFAREVAALRSDRPVRAEIDWTAFVVSFKGVLLEGLEAAFIVITFGSAARDARVGGLAGVGLAAVAAAAALGIVILAGLLIHRPLSRVPENTMKYAVGLMLTSFGTFWAGEGVGIRWPLEDATILLLLAAYAAASWLMVAALRRGRSAERLAGEIA
jgi:uncharacterized membrane protein